MRQPVLNKRRAQRLLRDHGFVVVKRAGNHGVKMTDGRRTVIVPRHGGADFGTGLTRAIIREAGLETEEVRAWISRSSSTRSAGASGRRSRSFPDASRQAGR